MALPTKLWAIAAAGNLVEYGAFPDGNVPVPSWAQIPNFLNQTASLSVDLKALYLTFAPGDTITMAVNGALPTGWSFSGTTLSFNGTSMNATPVSITVTATDVTLSLFAVSNTFQIQGQGAGSADTFAPTVPLGVSAVVAATTATLSGLPSSDPNPAGFLWKGLGQYNVTVTGLAGSPFTVASAAGNDPIFALQDVGAPAPASTFGQSGADVTLTTHGDAIGGTADQFAFAAQQLTAASFVLTCKIAAFTGTNPDAKAGLMVRVSNAPSSAYVSLNTNPFSQGHGLSMESRTSTGAAASATASATAKIANTTAPIWLILTVNTTTGVCNGFYSLDGNTLIPVGSLTVTLGAAIFAGAHLTSNLAGGQVSCTFAQLNLQTNANWSLGLTGLTPGAIYPVSVTAQDLASTPNVSAASAAYSIKVPSASGDTIPSKSQLIDGGGGVWTVTGGVVNLNGAATPSNSVILLLYFGAVIYQENSSGLWWSWNGTAWVSVAGDPRGSGGGGGGGGTVPAVAAAAGYNLLTLSSMLLAAGGGPWLPYNFGGSVQPAGSATQNSDGSILLPGTAGNSYNGVLSSAAMNAGSANGWKGTCINAFYLEAVVSFAGSTPGYPTNGWPAAPWFMAIEHLANDYASAWPAHSGQNNYAEWDVEWLAGGNTKMHTAAINWQGAGSGSPTGSEQVVDFSGAAMASPQTIGILHVPATASSKGYWNWYQNGVLVNHVEWNQYNPSNGAAPVAGSTAMAVTDVQHFPILFGCSSTGAQLTIHSVKVWQKDTSTNLVHT